MDKKLDNKEEQKSQEEELFQAAGEGDLAKVTELFQVNPKLISVRPFYGEETPLHKAAERGHTEVVEFLLASNADPNAKDGDGNTPLDPAKRSSLAKDVAKLLLTRTVHDPRMAICHAAFEGALDEVKELLRDNPDLVFSNDAEGRSPLHLAALQGHREVAEFLIANSANVAARDRDGLTPLHCAARRYSTVMVELLIANGADVKARTNSGGTALHFCDSVELAKVLLARKADINARDNDGSTALDLVVYEGQGHEYMIEFLRQQGGREYDQKPGNPFSQNG